MKTFIVGNKIYTICHECGKLVQINKPIVGSLHLCNLESDNAKEEKTKTT